MNRYMSKKEKFEGNISTGSGISHTHTYINQLVLQVQQLYLEWTISLNIEHCHQMKKQL